MAELVISESKKVGEKFSIRFKDVLNNRMAEKNLCFSGDILSEKLRQNSMNLERDLELMDQTLSYIFDESQEYGAVEAEQTFLALEVLGNKQGNTVSLYSMALFSLYKFGLPLDKENLVFSVLAAATMGDVENNLPYHNNYHYRKVMLHMMRIIAAHNRIFGSKKNGLDHDSTFKLLIAAPIHDLCHDGTNNSVNGRYEFARLEQKSFDYAMPILEAFGCQDDVLEDIRIMLLTTDVLPFGDPSSPVNQMAAAFDYHFGMSEEELPELSTDLAVLEERSDLTLLCMLLHAADIMNSIGISYDVTRAESDAINKEAGNNETNPDDIWLFLNKICMNSMMSEAVQCLAARPMKEIYERVKDDVKSSAS